LHPGATTQTRDITSAKRPWAIPKRGVGVWAGVAVVLFAYARIFQTTYIDDTYITLQYVRNLADHLSWGFFPGQTTNTATSPLNVIVLAAFAKVTGSALTAVALAMAVEWTLTLAVLLRISREIMGTAHAGLLTFAILASNPLLLSAIGLEGSLYILLLLTSLLMFLTGRWLPLALALGLLTVTRPEGFLLLAIVLPLFRASWRTRGKFLLIYGLTILPWYLFSWIHLGSLIPDTLIIKVDQQPWEGTTLFVNGPLLYLERFPAATLGSIWPLLFVPLALPVLRRGPPVVRRALAVLALYAVAHYLAYSVLGVPPFHWYYTHQIVAVAVLGGLGAAEFLRWLARGRGTIGHGLAYAATVLPAVTLLTLLAGQGPPLGQAPIHSNWARPEQYREIAAVIRTEVEPEATVDFRGEVGTLSYYSDRYLLDTFTDMSRTTAAIDRLEDDQPAPVRWLLAVNFLWRDDPSPLPAPTYVIDFGAPRPVAGVDPRTDPNYVDSWVTRSRWVPYNRIVLSRAPGT
jgi:hypothetical protein